MLAEVETVGFGEDIGEHGEEDVDGAEIEGDVEGKETGDGFG